MVMEAGASLLSCSYSSLSPSSSLSLCSHSSKTHFKFVSHNSHRPPSPPLWKCLSLTRSFAFNFGPSTKNRLLVAVPSTGCSSLLQTSAFVVEKALDNSSHSTKDKDMMPKIDKTGRFCSPRAARELALMILYAACLEGSDPIRLFEKRMNARREPGYEFDKASLLEYNHMSFGGPPIITETVEEADELLQADEKESAIEAEVLSAPPKLVYSRLLLRFTRKLLVAVVDKWDSHALFIEKVAPANWKQMPAGRILELCILHLAMAEIKVLGTRHQIVINEAVDLAKRFCDGAAPRIVNGCLRTFMKDSSGSSEHQEASDGNGKAEV